MESFAHLFASHFADPDRSLANTYGGFVDHAIRYAAGLPTEGPLAVALAAANTQTQALSARAQAAQQALGLRLGTQKEAGSQTATAQTTALGRIRSNEAALTSDLFIEDPQERRRLYALLYPTAMLGYYTEAKLGTELADRLGEYLTTTEAEAQALGEAFVARTLADLGPFRETRETQVGTLSKTGDARATRRTLADELDEQCDHNYHLLSAHFRQDLARPANFWNAGFYQRAAPAPAAAASQV